VIKSPKLNILSLTTNDVVQITGYKRFKYIGRSDNIINTGGIKVHPETLEKEIEKKLKSKDFFIDKIKDEVLGEKVILIALKSLKINIIQKVLKNISNQKIAPKLVLFTENFHLTENGKILRKKTKLESLKKGNLIIKSTISLISSGTERMLLSFGKGVIISLGNPSITPDVNHPKRRQIAISAIVIVFDETHFESGWIQFSSISNFRLKRPSANSVRAATFLACSEIVVVFENKTLRSVTKSIN